MEVNSYLKDLCESNDIPFISNTTINPKKHLNNSRLHLNPKRSNKLRDNFVRYLKGLTCWEIVKRNWPEGCSRSEDNVCSSSRVNKTSDNKEFSSEHLSFSRKKHPNSAIIGHINIDSIRNKFNHLIAIIKGNVNVLMVSEIKLDEPFSSMKFNIDGYNIFRSDRNAKGGGILMYVWDDIPCKLIPMRGSTTEGFFIELKLLKKKWLLCCSYTLIEDLFPIIWSILGRA